MSIINYATNEVEFKIVYYGPAFAGKTTNLRSIHSRLCPGATDGVTTLTTGADRTLFFEFVPERVTVLSGFRVRFQLFTVPGAVTLNVPRKLVLRDVDGIVFVADSQWDRVEESVICMSNLEDNLRRYGQGVDEVPMVLQYNKRDLRNIAPVDYLDFILNTGERPRPFLETVASRGENVFECLGAITDLILTEFRHQRPPVPGLLPTR